MKDTHPSDSTFGVARLGRWVFLVLVCTILARPHSISAADYYWDADPAANNLTTGAGLGGAGVWNASNLNWWDTSTSADVVWPGAAHRAVFWGTAGTVAVNDMSASGLLIKSTAGSYTLTGNGGGTARTLTLGADGITMESGAAATILGNNTGNGRLLFALSANQTWLNNSASALTVNGTINIGALTLTVANGSTGAQAFTQAFSGSGGIIVDNAGAGETIFSGASSSYTGAITIKSGTLVAGNSINALGAASTTVTLGSGASDAALRLQNGITYAQKIIVGAGGANARSVRRPRTSTPSRAAASRSTTISICALPVPER